MELIKQLFRDNYLLGHGYYQSLEELSKVLSLEVLNFKSGTEFGTWTVPNEWIVKDAYVKFNGEKIIDYTKDPLSLMVYSQPFNGIITKSEFIKHIQYSDEMPEHIPYQYSFYEPKWGFGVRKEFVFKKVPGVCPPAPEGVEMHCPDVYSQTETIAEGDYEVMIDTEFKLGVMQIGIHTIKGESDREILIFAHLDHPYQANDNLSGVYAAVKTVKKINCKHTIKIIFCPETIGSIAYTSTQDISKVDFVIALDCVGNDNDLLMQKSFNKYDRLNYCAYLALHEMGIDYRRGEFRSAIGSDEYMFNDPLIGIPGILVTRYPYKEYHTSADTPEIIKKDKIDETVKYILKLIDIYEKDYIPLRKEKGVLMRSKFGLQTSEPLINKEMDYLYFAIDGKSYLSELMKDYQMPFSYMYNFLNILKENGLIYEAGSINHRKGRKPKIKK